MRMRVSFVKIDGEITTEDYSSFSFGSYGLNHWKPFSSMNRRKASLAFGIMLAV